MLGPQAVAFTASATHRQKQYHLSTIVALGREKALAPGWVWPVGPLALDWRSGPGQACGTQGLRRPAGMRVLAPPSRGARRDGCPGAPLQGGLPGWLSGRLPPGAPAGMGVPAPPWGGPRVKAALGVPSRGLGWRCDKVRIRSGFGFSCFWGSPGAPWHANRGTCVFLIQALEFGAPARRCNVRLFFFGCSEKN